MGKDFWQYAEQRKKEEEAKGKKFDQTKLSEELGISRQYLSKFTHGKCVISYKLADTIERKTNGEINADELLEESIGWHKKWLERQKRFGKGKDV